MVSPDLAIVFLFSYVSKGELFIAESRNDYFSGHAAYMKIKSYYALFNIKAAQGQPPVRLYVFCRV
jgi:hypothetical protein